MVVVWFVVLVFVALAVVLVVVLVVVLAVVVVLRLVFVMALGALLAFWLRLLCRFGFDWQIWPFARQILFFELFRRLSWLV